MAGPTYVTKGYSTYTDFPAQEGGYDHEPKQPVVYYVVETTRIERVRTPAVRYTNFGGSPSKGELLKEYIHAPNMLVRPKYAPKDHHEGYEPNHGSDYENSSPPRYYGGENLMDEFLQKLQIEASRPMKTSNFSSSNNYRPTSPEYSYPSEESHLTRTRGLSGPNKYRPTSPEYSYPSEDPHLTRTRGLAGPNKYRPTSPEYSSPSEEAHLTRTRGLAGQNKYPPTSSEYSFPSEEAHLTRTQGLAGSNKYHPSSLGSEGGRHVRIQEFSGPNNHGPPVTRHPLTTSTNDVNEASSFQEETMNYSPRSGPKIKGGERDKSMEPERRYGKTAFVAETMQPHFLANTIDSQMALKKYRGAHVP